MRIAGPWESDTDVGGEGNGGKRARWYPSARRSRQFDLAAVEYESGVVVAWVDAEQGPDEGTAVVEVYRGQSVEAADAMLADFARRVVKSE